MISFGLGFTMKVSLGANHNIILIKCTETYILYCIVPTIKTKVQQG